jgi:hypothetical protein
MAEKWKSKVADYSVLTGRQTTFRINIAICYSKNAKVFYDSFFEIYKFQLHGMKKTWGIIFSKLLLLLHLLMSNCLAHIYLGVSRKQNQLGPWLVFFSKYILYLTLCIIFTSKFSNIRLIILLITINANANHLKGYIIRNDIQRSMELLLCSPKAQ